MQKYIAIAFLFFLWSFSIGLAQDRPAEFKEFEEIVSWVLRFSDGYAIPNQRQAWIKQAERYEAFAAKYPKSPLVAEANLQAASATSGDFGYFAAKASYRSACLIHACL